MIEEKPCSYCYVVKPRCEFYTRSDHKDGLFSECKTCRKKMNVRVNKTEKAIKRNRNWRLKREYGIDIVQYAEMLKKQSGKCLICSKEFATAKGTHIDHCHKTGKVRGILCSKCNKALGLFGDDVKILQTAILYLEKHQN